MIVNEFGIEKEAPEAMQEAVVDIYKKNDQLINTKYGPGMSLLNALVQMKIDIQDWIISLFTLLTRGACGIFLDNIGYYRGISRKKGANTLITLTVEADGPGVLYEQTTQQNPQYVVVDDGGNQYIPESDYVIHEAGTFLVPFKAVENGPVKPSRYESVHALTQLSFVKSVSNLYAPTYLGENGENDVVYQHRLDSSDGIRSYGMPQSIESQVRQLDGVVDVKWYQNNSDTEDSDGIPPFTFYLIVAGGDTEKIANVLNINIGNNGMLGSVAHVIDGQTMLFDRPQTINIYVSFDVFFENLIIPQDSTEEATKNNLKNQIKTKMAELASNGYFKIAGQATSAMMVVLATNAMSELGIQGACFNCKIGDSADSVDEDIIRPQSLNGQYALAAANIDINDYNND